MRSQNQAEAIEIDASKEHEQRIAEARQLCNRFKRVDFRTVSGRVFALTRGGDIKPARYAEVYILAPAYARAVATEALESSTAQMRELVEKKLLTSTSEFVPTLDRLQVLNHRLALVKAASEIREQVGGCASELFTATDLEGNFEIRGVPPAELWVYVVGRAGGNQAVWSSKIDVKPRQQIRIEMHSPDYSFLDIE
ncbi:MAG: hypothetical protein ACRD4U_08070 [Candidatus Acidiferrales bacterium]